MNPRYTPRLSGFDRLQCETIHRATLEVLRKTGVRVYEEEGIRLLQSAGAIVTDENLVKIPSYLVEYAIRQTTSGVSLCRRGSDKVAVPLEGDKVNFGPGSDCLYYLDPETGKRRFFFEKDLISCSRLIDTLDDIDFIMSMGIPHDLMEKEKNGSKNVYREQFRIMIENTDKPIVFVCNDKADCEAIASMAADASGGLENLRLNPTILLYSEPSTPLKHSKTATEKLLFMAENRLPIVHSPAPMMGGSAPVTLAGGLVLGNAEVLSGLVMHQLKRPGAPFVYGSGLHHMDMRTSISVYGAPEFQLARIGVASMGKYYGLPVWGYAGHTDSNLMDEQAASDAVFSVLVAFLTGTNLVHDIGYLEAGLMCSPEMIVFTNEVINMTNSFMKGIKLDVESLAVEVIDAVGPGGNFLTEDHTIDHFRDLWSPELFDRSRYDAWINGGGLTLGKRLKDKTIALLKE